MPCIINHSRHPAIAQFTAALHLRGRRSDDSAGELRAVGTSGIDGELGKIVVAAGASTARGTQLGAIELHELDARRGAILGPEVRPVKADARRLDAHQVRPEPRVEPSLHPQTIRRRRQLPVRCLVYARCVYHLACFAAGCVSTVFGEGW